MSTGITAKLLDGAPDARKINAEKFERQWSTTGRLKERFQYNLEVARKDFRHAVKTLGIPLDNQRVLDVGFGNGMLMFLFRPSTVICGTELSRSAIRSAERRARQRGYKDYCFKIPVSPEVLPFDSGCFDLVVASHVLEHVVADIEFLGEMLRVLRPGGHLMLILPLESRSDELLSEEDLLNPAYLAEGHFHVRHYNLPTLRERVGRLDGRIVLEFVDSWIWDWKSSLDQWRQPLSARYPGRLLDRLIAAAINVPLSVVPRSVLALLDRWMAARGYRPQQAVMVLRKSF